MNVLGEWTRDVMPSLGMQRVGIYLNALNLSKAEKNQVPGKVMEIPSDMQAPWLWTHNARHSFLITVTTWWATTPDGHLIWKKQVVLIANVLSNGEGLRSEARLMQVVMLLEGIVL